MIFAKCDFKGCEATFEFGRAGGCVAIGQGWASLYMDTGHGGYGKDVLYICPKHRERIPAIAASKAPKGEKK